MEGKGYIKHVFPGGNTPKGFFSYYDYILSQDEATRIFVIKGGPGVGKSSVMRSIGEYFVNEGYDIEHMHCSSDNGSLDGVVIQKLKVALLDGTAPHVVDPKNPGCVDEIVHLGDFWNEDGIRKYRNEIIETNREVGKIFARAYKYLNAAKSVYDDLEVIYGGATDFAKVNKETEKLIEKIFSQMPISSSIGKKRCLFASAITPDGLKNHIDTIIGDTKNLYILKGERGTGKSTMLSKIVEYALERGLYVEAYCCPLDPTKIEHVLIPRLDTILVTSNEYHNVHLDEACEIIDLNNYVNINEIAKFNTQINFDRLNFNELLNQAILTIGNAKRLHDLMETYYIPNMDFDKVEQKKNELIERILSYNNN